MSKIKKIKNPKELGLGDLFFMILRGKNTVILITLICTLLSLAGFFSSKQVYTVEKEIFALTDNVKNPFLSSLNNQDRFETVTLDINLYTKKAMFLNFKNSLIVNNYSEELINKISNVINFEGNKEEKYKLYLNIISNLRLDDKNQEKIKFYLEWHNLIDGNKILNEIIGYKKLKTEKYFQNLSIKKMDQALEVLKTKIKYYEEHEKNKSKMVIADLKKQILTARNSGIENYNPELKVTLPSYFQGYKALEEMLKHNENLLKNSNFAYSNEYYVFLEQIETLKSFIDTVENQLSPVFANYSEDFYLYNVNKSLKDFLIFGFIVGFILSIIILISRKKLL